MKKYAPYEKLTKKQRRAIDREARGSWGEINPVTRTSENPKAYNRKKEVRRLTAEMSGRGGGFHLSGALR